MIFVVGGRASGKRVWVKEHLGYDEDGFSSDPASTSPVLFDLQDHVAEVSFDDLMTREVVICDEVGCGLVPTDPAAREQREAVGRLACRLARNATCVVRVVCGIGTVIEGELPPR